MAKRNLATILWFIAGWWGGELIVGLTGLPYLLTFIPGIALAGLVYFDPFSLFWPGSMTAARRVRPINELADELHGNAGQPARSEADRSRV
jgi:hypothetical protein